MCIHVYIQYYTIWICKAGKCLILRGTQPPHSNEFHTPTSSGPTSLYSTFIWALNG